MKTTSRFIVIILVLGAILGGIFGYKFYQFDQLKQQLSQPQPPARVEAVDARLARWQPAIRAVGSTRAVNGIAVANEVAGVVEALNFESGQRVEKGNVLVRLDADTDRAALETRKAEAQLALQQYERFSDLLPRKAVSQAQFDEAKANYDAAQARVVEARAQLNKKIIRAPFGGIIGLRQVDLGEFLPVGTPIVEINMLDPMYVDYTLPEKDLNTIRVGDSVEVNVAAYPDRTFTGSISAINSSVNPESRTVRVRATLPNGERLLRPGMFTSLRTLRSEERELVTVPRTAVSYNTYGTYVFIIADNDQGEPVVQRRSITAGETRDGQVEVLDGLKAGETVVKSGLLRLRNDQRVEIASEAQDGKGAPSSGREAEG